MTQVPELYDLASRQNIAVLRYPMKENGSMSLMEPDGTCYIGMDDRVLDGGIQERMHLGHELGHCMTGSFYNIYATVDCRQRHENHADKWAIRALIPVEQLDEAIALGYTELWQLADFFGVTESFMRKITYQELTRGGLEALAPTITAMAEAEGLDAHANAVRIRTEGGAR